MPIEGLRRKSWEEFAGPEAPEMHFVFTVCDSAAAEMCPVWPGHPLTARWSVPDSAAVQGMPQQVTRAFFEAYTILDRRITLFLSLPLASLERQVIQSRIDQIGRTTMRRLAEETVGTALLLATESARESWVSARPSASPECGRRTTFGWRIGVSAITRVGSAWSRTPTDWNQSRTSFSVSSPS